MSPLEIVPLHPAKLHHFWSFLEPGLNEIREICRAEWIPEDHYAGIYNGRIEAFLMQREDRLLGFYDGYPMPLVMGKPELKYFIYAIWSKYPRDREKTDYAMMMQDRNQTLEFMKHRARELKCVCIEAISPRTFQMKIGFEEHARVYRMTV